MTVSLFNRMLVKDFDAWLNPDQDQVAQFMKSQGVLAFGLTRNADNPNLLTVHYQFADERTAESYQAMYEAMQPNIEDNQVISGTSEWWGGEDFRPFTPS